MRPQPYPKYKQSGVEWLGEVPEHWSTPSLYIRYQVDLGKMLNETATRGDHLHPYLRNVDVQWNHINVSDLPQMDIGPWEISRFTVAYGDLLVCEGGEVGRAALVRGDADGLGYQKALHRLRPLAAGEDPRFMFYTLYGAAQRGVFVAGGNPNTIAHLTGEKLRRYRFPAPLAFEQRAIADFLDRETAKIDTLVVKKRMLIERLKEKRSALISHTATRGLLPDAAHAAGLDPHPKLRPTGVEWLGQIPESWGTKRVSLLARAGAKTFTDGDWVELPYITENGVRLLQTGNVGIGEYREKGFRYIDESSFSELRCTEVEPGDVLICRLAEPVGRACLAPDLNCRMITSVDVCILKLETRMDRRYVVYFLSSKVYLDFVESLCRGGTRDRISRSMLGAIRALVPSIREQCAISDFLDRETSKIDTMVAKIETAIERLHEYRSALITAAVTGKIDVRGTVVREEDAA